MHRLAVANGSAPPSERVMIRLIVKITHQPPIDSPATTTWRSYIVDCPELEQLLEDNWGERRYDMTQVVGAEPGVKDGE